MIGPADGSDAVRRAGSGSTSREMCFISGRVEPAACDGDCDATVLNADGDRIGRDGIVLHERVDVQDALADFSIVGVSEDLDDPGGDLPDGVLFIPRVVKAGVPIRMPLGSIGLRVSKGIRFLLTVIPARPGRPRRPCRSGPSSVMSIRIRWLSVPPDTSRKPARSELVGERPGVGDDLRRVVLEVGQERLAEADRLARDDVIERAALEAGEDRRIELLGPRLPCRGRPRRAGRARSCAWSS